MVNKEGKLFHIGKVLVSITNKIIKKNNFFLTSIDFGHFLGHFKKKLGIKRERVPVCALKFFSYL